MTLRKNPWTTLGSKQVYKNPWITVREDQVVRPDGSEGIYGVVETRVATGVIALDSQNNIYLVGQHRYPFSSYSWEIVEGGADLDEEPLDAIKRELKEEAGLEAACWRKLGASIQLSNCFTSEIAEFYVATELQHVDSAPDPTEVLEIQKLPFSEAMKMVYSGEIQDAMSVIALMQYESCLRDDKLASELLSDYL